MGGLIVLMAGYTSLCWSAASLYYDFDFLLCMALGALIPNVRDMRESLVSRVSKVIAQHSYGVYLCHIPVIWFSFVRLSRLPPAAQWVVCAGIMVGLPALAYRLVEAPMIRAGQRLASLSAARNGQAWATGPSLLVDGGEPSVD